MLDEMPLVSTNPHKHIKYTSLRIIQRLAYIKTRAIQLRCGNKNANNKV